MKLKFFIFAFFAIPHFIFGQTLTVEGAAFEVGNRGYLNQAQVLIKDAVTDDVYCKVETDAYGLFKCSLPPVNNFVISITKDSYKSFTKNISKSDFKSNGYFLKAEMERAPGYLFEITLANKREAEGQTVEAISGALIEVYNNTKAIEILKLEKHQQPEFKVNLEKGNHYTILVRKEGYLAKQMEVYVNVKGCILCFEGISNVRPGITENLTAKNEYGVLLANVEMEKVFSGKTFEINNIYYEVNSSALNETAKKELDKIVSLVKYNPNVSIEIGSHTDVRGSSSLNQNLSSQRANTVKEYITSKLFLSTSKIVAVGYGESKVKNKCSEGVPCTEEEHQQNRRTEVKILELSDSWTFKPLVNIKNEENFQKSLMSDGLNDNQVKGESKSDASTSAANNTNVDNNKPAKKEIVAKEEVIKSGSQNESSDHTKIKNTTESDSAVMKDASKQPKDGVYFSIFRGPSRHPKEKDLMVEIPTLEVYKDAYGLFHYILGWNKNLEGCKKMLSPQLMSSFPKGKFVELLNGNVKDLEQPKNKK